MTECINRPPNLWLLVFMILFVFATTGLGAELVIIAHSDTPTHTIDAKALQRIYMGKQTRWDNDEAIVPVMLKACPVHEVFVESYLDRSPHRFVTYWRQMIFTGKGTPPRSFASETELAAYVAVTPGSVGYASASLDVEGVKVLKLVED